MLDVSQKKLFSSLGQAHEFELAMIKNGVVSKMIQDAIDGKLSISFIPVLMTAKKLSFKQFLSWLKKNNLDSKLLGGLKAQIAEQEKFYQQFYGEGFRIDCKKIFVDARRLPAIKAGLEADSVNYAEIKATPEILSEAEAQMTEAEFFFERLMKPLKKNDFSLWAEEGTDRWTKLELAELLKRCNPAEPEEFDSMAFKADPAKEIIRISVGKEVPRVVAGMIEMTFTSNLVDIPSDQIIVNKDGEIVTPGNRSYVSAIDKKVRVLSNAEGIILESQLFFKNKTYLALKTWEWRRDLIVHQDTGVNPSASVAGVYSSVFEFGLLSRGAGCSYGGCRLRLAL